MIVKMFKPQFARLVEQGRKLQTIRPAPKRPQKLNDDISLREWTGKPYRSKQRELRKSKCESILPVFIFETRVSYAGYEFQSKEELDMFAELDGFKDWNEMKDWFQKEHKLPFAGMLYRWT